MIEIKKLSKLLAGGLIAAAAFAMSIEPGTAQQKRYGQSGVFPGGTANAYKKPHLLAPRGFTKINKSGVSAKKARIAFEHIRGGLTFHNQAINEFAPAFVRRNKVKVVSLDDNPTHIIKARLSAFETGEAPIVQYNWDVIDYKTGQRVQRFVDIERGARVPDGLRWYGISEIELKNISQIAADRLVYWLDIGAE